MAQPRHVADLRDLPPGSSRAVELEGNRIALFNIEGTIFAVDDTCPHAGGPLSEGDVVGTRVECPWHGACFELTDGRVLNPPAEDGVRCYRVLVQGDRVCLEVP